MTELDEIKARIVDLERSVMSVNPYMPEYSYLNARLKRSNWYHLFLNLIADNDAAN